MAENSPNQPNVMTDHDMLISLHADMSTLLKRLNGYVPEHCITNESRITAIENAMREWSKVKWAAIVAVVVMAVQAIPKLADWLSKKI